MRVKILGLLCIFVLLGPAKATEATPGQTSPTMQDMVKWKSDVLSKFDDITYLDEDSKPISEDVFFSRAVAEKRGFTMQTKSSAPKHMTIRFLSDTEQRAAQAGMK